MVTLLHGGGLFAFARIALFCFRFADEVQAGFNREVVDFFLEQRY